jgi:hypothetical protein
MAVLRRKKACLHFLQRFVEGGGGENDTQRINYAHISTIVYSMTARQAVIEYM